jgi:internalin A
VVLLAGGLTGCSSSDDGDGGTAPVVDTTAPAQVTDFQAFPGDGQVILSWTNPTGDVAGVEIRKASDAIPTRTTGDVIHDGMTSSYVDGDVTNDQTYYYAAFAYDNAGNYSAAVGNSCTPHVAAAVVISDANLELLLRTELGIPSGDITDLNMATLVELDASYEDIAHLQGIQHAINLTDLDLGGNPLTNDSDLQLLAQLTRLERLTLSGTDLTILPDLSALSMLESLYLAGVPITSLSPLSGVTSLKRLQFANCDVSDLAPLADLANLEYLSFQNTEVANLGPLAGLDNLRNLSVMHSPVADVSSVVGLPNLEALSVAYAEISDLSQFSSATQLTDLGLGGNGLDDISDLSGLTGLSYLGLESNSITDLSPLAGMTQMTHLQLSGNQVSDLSPLSGLADLEYFMAFNNLISDITVLLGKTELIAISLSNNPLTTSAAMDDVPTLESAGVEVDFDYEPDVLQLMGPWVADSVTVNGTSVTLGDFFDWETGTVATHLTVFPSRAYTSQEVDSAGEVLYHDGGYLEMDGASVSVMVYTENGEDVTPHEAFVGTWARSGTDLVLTTVQGADTIVLTWSR